MGEFSVQEVFWAPSKIGQPAFGSRLAVRSGWDIKSVKYLKESSRISYEV